jgi:hypothetical protein
MNRQLNFAGKMTKIWLSCTINLLPIKWQQEEPTVQKWFALATIKPLAAMAKAIGLPVAMLY